VKDFPACVVPALPDKHRLGSFDHLRLGMLNDPLSSEYITGDRFSPEFMERRRLEYVKRSAVVNSHCMTDFPSLHRFLQRVGRHPTLQRSTLLRAFFESTEWVTIVSKLLLSNYADSRKYSTSTCTSTLHTPQGLNPHQEFWIIFPTRF
jgi:hypothetical protein